VTRHDIGGDLDRVAAQVVDLEPLGRDVAHPRRDLGPGEPRPAPPEAAGAVGALIGAEQQDRGGLVGLEQIEADRDEGGKQRARDEQRPAEPRRPLDLRRADDGNGDADQQHDKHDVAVERARGAFARRAQVAQMRCGGKRGHESLPLILIS